MQKGSQKELLRKLIPLKVGITVAIASVAFAATCVSLRNPNPNTILVAQLVILVLGIGLIVGLTRKIPLIAHAAGVGLMIAGSYLMCSTWSLVDSWSQLTFKQVIEFEFGVAFLVAGVVVILMKVSDIIDRRYGIVLIDDRPT